MFILLHIWSLSSTRVIIRFFITILTKVILHQLLGLARRPALRRILVVSNFFHLRVRATCFWETSMKQNVFSELFPRCVAWRNPVSELYRHLFWPQGLFFALICIISCWTFYQDVCAFPNHTHSIEFATGYLHPKSSNTYKQYKCSWAKFELSQIRVCVLMQWNYFSFLFAKIFKKKKLCVCFTIIVYGM